MNKVILSSLALLGLSVAFVAPAQAETAAQPRILVNSTSSGASITGAAAVSNFNGMTSTAAVQVTYPNGVYAESAIATPIYHPLLGETLPNEDSILILSSIEVKPGADLKVDAPQGASVEGAVAALITGTTDTPSTLGERVSYIRAWRSGLN